MTQHDKLIERIRARPPFADFGDVQRLLEGSGWKLARAKGSHCAFTKPGQGTLVASTVSGRKVKRYILDDICERLGLDG